MRFGRLGAAAFVGLAASSLSMLAAAAASSNIIVTYAGNGSAGFSGNSGPATSAMLNYPSGVVLDNAAHVFVADTANNRVRKVTADGVITTVAGTGAQGFSGDGGQATAATLTCPTGLAVDRAGNLFISDTGNNRVRKVNSRGVITTVAGSGRGGGPRSRCGVSDEMVGRSNSGNIKDAGSEVQTSEGREARSANLDDPTGIAVERNGGLLVADTGNNVVREVRRDGTVVRFAGTGKPGFSGNTGPAIHAKLNAPRDVAVAGTTVLISDTENHQVRKVVGGVITGFAGTGQHGFFGDGGQASAAKLTEPVGVAFDPLGDVYIVDAGNHRLRQVSASGVISTFAGTGKPGYSGDGGPAELAEIHPNGGVTTDASNVFFGDTYNHRVRRIHKGGPPPALPEAPLVALAGGAMLVLGGGVVLTHRARERDRRGSPVAFS